MDGNKDSYIGLMLDNRYEIIEKVGEGGMAVVYKARCHRLNRLVAVKILRPEFAGDEDFRRRFHAESQAVAMLSHPNIVAVYDVNRSQGVEYLVMELIDGITLKQYMMRKGELNWRESLHFTTQIVRALIHAHSRGIIHRDIKPHNVMVLRDGSIKVADFGIARLATSQNTLTQEALGSVHYISPEQAKGGQVDARSDIYSVGVVLYEMLTGRLPFEGDSPVAVAIQHISSMALSPREIDPSIPEGLEEITKKAMNSDITKRYASAEEMHNDLEEFRKNPGATFGYDDLAYPPEAREPTRKLPDVGHLAVGKEPVKKPVTKKLSKPAKSRRERDDEPRRSPVGIIATVVAVLMVFAVVGVMLYFLWQVVTPVLFPEGQSVRVPSLVGEIYTEILDKPEEYSLGDFTFELDPVSVYGDEPEGTIIEQSPEGGSYVTTKKNVIKVTVSKGPRAILLDQLAGQEYRTAEIRLTKLGLLVGYEYETSEDVLKDHVIRTIPEASATLGEGDEVVLVVSTGPNVVKVDMPKLIGRTEEAAKALLKQLRLNIGEVKIVESTSEAGSVIWQSIQEGVEIDEGTQVGMQISSGPPPSPSPSPEIPSIEPSAEPSTAPSYEPPSPPSSTGLGETTIRIRINLPQDRESVRVQVIQDGITVYDQTVATDQGTINPPLTGTGTSWVEVYIDSRLEEAKELSFE